MCIDILMREESDGNRGILSLMKELSLKYGKNRPFEDDKLFEEIVKMTYPSIGDFFETHVITFVKRKMQSLCSRTESRLKN